jgi:hypothetical protein
VVLFVIRKDRPVPNTPRSRFIINAKSDPYDSTMSRFRQNYHHCISFIEKLDEAIFKSKPDAFERKDTRALLGATTYLTVMPIICRSRFSASLLRAAGASATLSAIV